MKTVNGMIGLLNNTETDNTTFNIAFLDFNIREIINRIKLLFKQEFIYDVDAIFTLIRQKRDYTAEQIYNALTIMLEDSTIHLVDKYNRIGRLINIDELYIFSPIELDDIYDTESASRPLEFNIPKITFTKQQDEALETQDKREMKTADVTQQIYSLLEDLALKIEITKTPQDVKTIEGKQDTTWYSYMSYYITF